MAPPYQLVTAIARVRGTAATWEIRLRANTAHPFPDFASERAGNNERWVEAEPWPGSAAGIAAEEAGHEIVRTGRA
jgi:hypothetical protein